MKTQAAAQPDGSRILWMHDCPGPDVTDQVQEARDGDSERPAEAEDGDLSTLSGGVGGVTADTKDLSSFGHANGGAIADVAEVHLSSIPDGLS